MNSLGGVVASDIFGLKVVSSPDCVHRRHDGFEIVKNPKRRRRRYTVQKRYRFEPIAYRANGVLYMHPTLYEKLKNHPDIKVSQ